MKDQFHLHHHSFKAIQIGCIGFLSNSFEITLSRCIINVQNWCIDITCPKVGTPSVEITTTTMPVSSIDNSVEITKIFGKGFQMTWALVFHEAWNYPIYRYIVRLLVATCCDDADAPIVIDNTLSRHLVPLVKINPDRSSQLYTHHIPSFQFLITLLITYSGKSVDDQRTEEFLKTGSEKCRIKKLHDWMTKTRKKKRSSPPIGTVSRTQDMITDHNSRNWNGTKALTKSVKNRKIAIMRWENKERIHTFSTDKKSPPSESSSFDNQSNLFT